MSISRDQYQVRTQIFTMLRAVLSEKTGNRIEDIKEQSLIYSELNLTELDLQKIVTEMGLKLEIATQGLNELIAGSDEVRTVGDVVDLLVDEKELG